eukprot:scaffold226027_cov56-Attheya_sp.AAC.1
MRLSERRSDGKIPRLMGSGVCKTPYLIKKSSSYVEGTHSWYVFQCRRTPAVDTQTGQSRDYPNAIRLKLPKTLITPRDNQALR